MSEPLPNPLIERIIEVLREKKAQGILLMDLRSSTDTTDFFVLCTATSDLHIKSLANEVSEELKKEGHRSWHIEGYKTRRWILVDYVDVVVHIFRKEAREFYALERLWGDAAITAFDDDLPATEPPDERESSQFVFSRP